MKKKIYGVLLLMETLFLFLSAAVSLCYGENDFFAFFITTLLCGTVGFSLFYPNRKKSGGLSRRDCYIIISGIWVVFSLFGMIPFLIYGTVDSLADAFFETMSGFTTTGASILNNIDEQPHGILLWRSIQQWLGGLGIMVFSIALLPSFNGNNRQLFSTEVTSIYASKLRPKTQETAQGILLIYALLTILCAFFYFIGPMNAFDSICHAMTTLGTGGFSTHQDSIAFFHSTYIEYVCSIFMIMAGINFSLYFFASQGNWTPFKQNEELHWYLFAVTILIITFTILFQTNIDNCTSSQMPSGIADSIQAAIFHTASIITSGGFQGTYCDYDAWGPSFWIPTLLMMIVGACAGSSSGGIKLIRFIIWIKNTYIELKLHSHPNAIFPLKISNRVIPEEMIHRTSTFLLLVVIVVFIGTFILTCTGLSFDTAFGSCISAVSNSGPGFGSTGPITNYSSVSDFGKWTLSFLMLIGRLEIYTIILLFSVSFWKK